MHPHYHTRTMKTAEKIIENLTVNVLDTARLIQEAAEELGERAKGLESPLPAVRRETAG